MIATTQRSGAIQVSTTSLAALAAVVLAAIPLLIGRPAPLQDWMSHLARVHILNAMLHGDSFWRQFYGVNTFFLPNVVLDVAVLLLLRLGLDLQTAAQLFLLAIYAAWVGGFCVLSMTLRSYDAQKPLLAAILFFSGPLYWGFVNFVTGVALIPWFLAGIIRLQPRPWIAVLVAAAGTMVIFFCHIFAAALFVGFLGCFDLLALVRSREATARRLLGSATSLTAAVIALILLHYSPTGGDLSSASMKYVSSGSLSGFAYWKASIFLRALVEGGGLLSAALTVLGLGALAGINLFGARLSIDAAPSLAVVGLVTATIAAPERFGSGSFVDYRLALMPLLVIAMAIRSTWRRPVLGRAAFAVVLAVLVARSVCAIAAWSAAARVYDSFEKATASLPNDSVLLTAWGRPPGQVGWSEWWSPSVGNISALAVVHRVFVPTVFALASQQPLALLTSYRSWSVFLDLSDPARVARALRRLVPFCDQESQRVFVTLLFPKALDRRIAQAPVIFRDHRVRLVQICPVTEIATVTAPNP